ncbi:DUF3293 domain-containing protein [Paraperlucidibaca wandonensis]|jgi:hypothetical protein|uniref:DUF3293 domain-containing protein n=1 Tax=Paraperlucidibaca wandonensis TaxID=1268273 RepID=A0ABW3HD54_9GAMM
MTVLSNELIAAYQATHYTIQADGEVITLRIGQHSPAVKEWLSKQGITEAGYITAVNPLGDQLADAINESLHNDLLELVMGEGLQTRLGEGVGLARLASGNPKWPAERSLLISPLSRDGARQIGSIFSQNAVVHITNDAAELILLR